MSERVLVVGEALVDRIAGPDGSEWQRPGGSPANVALGLARLGRPVDLWTALGDDPAGHRLADHLTAQGVRLVGDPWCLDRTSTATASIGSAGDASWTFDLQWRLAGLPEPGFVAVHTGSVAALLEPGAERMHRFLGELSNGVLRSYDLNVRPVITGSGPEIIDRVRSWLDWADVVRASTQDLVELWPDQSPRQVADGWFNDNPDSPIVSGFRRPGTAVISDGPGGVIRLSRFSQETFPTALPVGAPVVDTIGAGDALTAALLDGLLRYRGEMEDWTPVIERAVRAAALSVTRAGAEPPTLAELDG